MAEYHIEDLSCTITGEMQPDGGYRMHHDKLHRLLEDLHEEGWELVGFWTESKAVFRRREGPSHTIQAGDRLELATSLQVGDVVGIDGRYQRVTELGTCILDSGELCNISELRLIRQQDVVEPRAVPRELPLTPAERDLEGES